MGSHAALKLEELGARLVAVNDHTATLINPDGISAVELAKHVAQHRGIKGFQADHEVEEVNQFWAHETDFMVLAAMESTVTQVNAA